MNCLLRILRLKGITQADLVRQTGIPQSQICKFATINRGMSPTRIIELADHLDISLDELFCRDHYTKENK